MKIITPCNFRRTPRRYGTPWIDHSRERYYTIITKSGGGSEKTDPLPSINRCDLTKRPGRMILSEGAVFTVRKT
jgi:hypothetical protein